MFRNDNLTWYLWFMVLLKIIDFERIKFKPFGLVKEKN